MGAVTIMVRQQVSVPVVWHTTTSYQHWVVVMLEQELTVLKPLGVCDDFCQIPNE